MHAAIVCTANQRV